MSLQETKIGDTLALALYLISMKGDRVTHKKAYLCGRKFDVGWLENELRVFTRG